MMASEQSQLSIKHALNLLKFSPGSSLDSVNKADLRKRYLRLALNTHPDKNAGDGNAAQRFQDLQAAYNFILKAITDAKELKQEQNNTAELLELYLKALLGGDVEQELLQRGLYRPPNDFGINLATPFDKRVIGMHDAANECDIREALTYVFQEEGLDEEGNPLEGWARAQDVSE